MASLRKRGRVYYASYYVGGREYRHSLETTSYQLAKERLRELETALGTGSPESLRPSKTPIADMVGDYVDHIQTIKTKASFKTDRWYLRSIFGTICPQLNYTRPPGSKSKKPKAVAKSTPRLHVAYVEEISTPFIAQFIDAKVLQNGIAPKSANRYREILMRFINWAMDQRGVRMPGGVNPAKKVLSRRQPASEIRFLETDQITVQLEALQDCGQLQTMVAVYIYAGLRREELLWLTRKDVDLTAGKYGMIRIRAKTVHGAYWEPKTKRNRAVPISSALRYYLDRYRPPKTLGQWYFPSPKGVWWDPDNFSHHLAQVNKKFGLRWSCLAYRHTFGSHLAMKGESLYKISTLMGNSPEICRRHYAALLPESMIDSVEFGEPDPGFAPQARAKPALRVISNCGELIDTE